MFIDDGDGVGINYWLSVFAYQIEKLKYAKESIEEMTVISRALNHDYAELTTMGLPTSSMEVIRKWKAWPMIEHADLNDKKWSPDTALFEIQYESRVN